jgi:gamma-glutamyl:cysteine ligase YbdK (ATP-grasp superfamily)
MGSEIPSHHFHKNDFRAFDRRLREETDELQQWFADHEFLEGRTKGGYEIEAWIIDGDCRPISANDDIIKRCKDPHVVPELARFNLELNSEPYVLEGDALHSMYDAFSRHWQRCNEVAESLDTQLLMIGILPTVSEQDLTVENMSNWQRYRALNEQVLRLREGRPLKLDINGREHLQLSKHDVMLESAATSFQIHLKVNPDNIARVYNAARIISAPMVALSANSPYFFGKDLWDETRIPLFEQSVALRGYDDGPCGPVRRVSFGVAYVRESMFECFKENLECFPVLLPVSLEDEAEPLAHLRLHNGTIWRWNRPLIGFNERGEPHLRLEHRVVAAGPTIVDGIANAAFFYGLVTAMSRQSPPPEQLLSFDQARVNFYEAARYGLASHITWLDGKEVSIRDLLLQELLPLSRRGLNELGIDQEDIEHYLDIIKGRLDTAQNGAAWQRAYVAKHGRDMYELTLAYQDNHRAGNPVHEWPV